MQALPLDTRTIVLCQAKGHDAEWLIRHGRGERAVLMAFVPEAFDINISDRHLRCKLKTFCFCQHQPVFGDERVSGENDIRRGFAWPCCRERYAAKQRADC